MSNTNDKNIQKLLKYCTMSTSPSHSHGALKSRRPKAPVSGEPVPAPYRGSAAEGGPAAGSWQILGFRLFEYSRISNNSINICSSYYVFLLELSSAYSMNFPFQERVDSCFRPPGESALFHVTAGASARTSAQNRRQTSIDSRPNMFEQCCEQYDHQNPKGIIDSKHVS